MELLGELLFTLMPHLRWHGNASQGLVHLCTSGRHAGYLPLPHLPPHGTPSSLNPQWALGGLAQLRLLRRRLPQSSAY